MVHKQKEIMRLTTIVAILLFAIASHAQSYKELVSDGTRYLEKGDAQSAIKSYNKAISKEPDNRYNEYIYANLAVAYQKTDSTTKAEEMYTKALSLNPSSIILLQQRGNLYLNTDKRKKALADFNAILKKEPYNEEALYNRAYIHVKEKHKEQAYKDYYAILTANPSNDKARFALALLYDSDNNQEKALLLIDFLIEKTPNTAEYYIAASEFAEKQEMKELAMVYIEEGIEACKDEKALLMKKAELLLAMKQKDEAKEILKRLIKEGYQPGKVNALCKKCK